MFLGGMSPMAGCKQQTLVAQEMAKLLALVSHESRRTDDRSLRKGFVVVHPWIHERWFVFDNVEVVLATTMQRPVAAIAATRNRPFKSGACKSARAVTLGKKYSLDDRKCDRNPDRVPRRREQGRSGMGELFHVDGTLSRPLAYATMQVVGQRS
jgi:hypothetical protein